MHLNVFNRLPGFKIRAGPFTITAVWIRDAKTVLNTFPAGSGRDWRAVDVGIRIPVVNGGPYIGIKQEVEG